MTVYVDDMMDTVVNVHWCWPQACHMVSPDTNELHDFATRLGLKRSWFQGTRAMPHYDLTAAKRSLAIRLGAVPVSRKDWLAIFCPIRDAWVQRQKEGKS